MAIKEQYTKCLTRDYLESVGITEVTTDGKVFRNGKELNQFPAGGNTRKDYIYVSFYCKGHVTLPVHRLMYAWFYRIIPKGMVVDHINDIKTDNRIDNLQLLTPSQNVAKNKNGIQEYKCRLDRPREFYIAKVEYWTNELNKLKEIKDTLQRGSVNWKEYNNVNTTKLRYEKKLRYYDNHKGE